MEEKKTERRVASEERGREKERGGGVRRRDKPGGKSKDSDASLDT